MVLLIQFQCSLAPTADQGKDRQAETSDGLVLDHYSQGWLSLPYMHPNMRARISPLQWCKGRVVHSTLPSPDGPRAFHYHHWVIHTEWSIQVKWTEYLVLSLHIQLKGKFLISCHSSGKYIMALTAHGDSWQEELSDFISPYKWKAHSQPAILSPPHSNGIRIQHRGIGDSLHLVSNFSTFTRSHLISSPGSSI